MIQLVVFETYPLFNIGIQGAFKDSHINVAVNISDPVALFPLLADTPAEVVMLGVNSCDLPERYQFSADFFYSNLVTEMNKSNQQKYVHFYTPEEANKAGMDNPHQYIGLDFLDFTVENVRESKTTQDVKRENVPVSVEVNGRKTTGSITATANFTKYRREIISDGKLHVRVIDAVTKNVAEQRVFEGSYTWVCEWGRFTGDDRALSDEQKKLAARQATLPPPNQDLFVEFTKPIYTQVDSYIKTVYRKY